MFLDTYRNLRDFFSDGMNADQAMIPFSALPTSTQKVAYDLYDKGMVFRDWFELHATEQQNVLEGERESPYLDTLIKLVRKEDAPRLGDAQGVFRAGLYDQVRTRANWGETKDTHAGDPDMGGGALPFLVGSEIKGLFITWEDMLRLCETFQAEGIIGNSPIMVDLYQKTTQACAHIKQNAHRPPNVLLYGETGTGKELFARAIHKLSGRRGEFRAVNCAGLPLGLLESELFGHVKGAFTDAAVDKAGILETCVGGIVHLDEINKADVGLLHKLLRAFQEREIRRVGGNNNIKIDVLFIAATNEDLASKPNFPKDALARLSEVPLRIPALRDRWGDVPLLVNHILQAEHCNSPLNKYRFPLAVWCEMRMKAGGNVRDLQNLIRSVAVRAHDQNGVSDPKETALRAAIDKAQKDGLALPLAKKQVADRTPWNGKPKVSRSLLNNSAWNPVVQKLVQEGKIG